jgi:hypothetical protein
LEELLDYLYFVKDRKGEYMLHGKVEVRGILCVGGMEMKESTELNIVRIVKYGDLLGLKIEAAEQYAFFSEK